MQLHIGQMLHPSAAKLLADMTRSERKLQLRCHTFNGADGTSYGTWRPPCAVGEAACDALEKRLSEWRVRSSQEVDKVSDLEVLLAPCFFLLRLVVVSSQLHRAQLVKARGHLSPLAASLSSAPSGSFLAAIAAQLRARVILQLARGALTAGQPAEAAQAARCAHRLLQERQCGARSFWPPHALEIAAAARVAALGEAALGNFPEALLHLHGTEELLWPAIDLANSGSSHSAVPTRSMVLALLEDIRALRLECEVARRMSKVVDGSLSLPECQSLLAAAEVLLADAHGQRVCARLSLLAAALSLLGELPWHAAGADGRGGARTEVMEQAAKRLALARDTLSNHVCLCRVAPVEVVCMAMHGDVQLAAEQAAAWSAAAKYHEQAELSCSLSVGCGQPPVIQRTLVFSLTRPVTLEPHGDAPDNGAAERDAWAKLVREHCVGE